MLKALNKKNIAYAGLMGGVAGTGTAQIKIIKRRTGAIADSQRPALSTPVASSAQILSVSTQTPSLRPSKMIRGYSIQVKKLKALKYATNTLAVKLARSGQKMSEFISSLPTLSLTRPTQNATGKKKPTKSLHGPVVKPKGRAKAHDREKDRAARVELIARA